MLCRTIKPKLIVNAITAALSISCSGCGIDWGEFDSPSAGLVAQPLEETISADYPPYSQYLKELESTGEITVTNGPVGKLEQCERNDRIGASFTVSADADGTATLDRLKTLGNEVFAPIAYSFYQSSREKPTPSQVLQWGTSATIVVDIYSDDTYTFGWISGCHTTNREWMYGSYDPEELIASLQTPTPTHT